jgi:hypothetical protein
VRAVTNGAFVFVGHFREVHSQSQSESSPMWEKLCFRSCFCNVPAPVYTVASCAQRTFQLAASIQVDSPPATAMAQQDSQTALECTSLGECPDDTDRKAKYGDVQEFLRTLTNEEKVAYSQIKGSGSMKRKSDFRTLLSAQRLTNLKSQQVSTSSTKTEDTVVGTYRNIYVIAEKEGGLMDRAFGLQVAANIAAHCKTKGPPALMWDEVGKVVKYLHCEQGQSDIQSRTRSSILSADAEMEPEVIRLAMQQATTEGLVPVPEEEFAKLLGTIVTESPLPIEAAGGGKKAVDEAKPEETGNEPPELDLKALTQKFLESSDGGDSNEHLVRAVLLQQIMQKPIKKEKGQEKTRQVQVTKVPKVKTEEEKLWQECLVFGRKLEGIFTNGSSICAQTQEDANEWRWAKGQVYELETILTDNKHLVHKWSSNIRSSTLPMLQTKVGTDIFVYLEALKVDIQRGIDLISDPLGVLVGMHSTMLRKRSYHPEKKIVEKKPKVV